MRRTARIALLAALPLLIPLAARGQTSGRLTIMDDYDQMSGPDATLDAALLRLYFRSENLGGKDRSLVVDMRSDLPTLASAPNPYGGLFSDAYPFNDFCRGLNANATPCQNLAVRNVTLGQLRQLAGVYDAYLMFGGLHEDTTAVSLGRKTIYEAGMTTVDGLTVERTFSPSLRLGAFAGLAPDPLTRLLDPDYQAAGGYFSLTHSSAVVRLAAAAQGYKGQPDLVSVYNQDFLKLAKGLTLAANAYVDVQPTPQDRLVWADLTYSPTSRYRLRFNVTRFRPVLFAQSPDLYIQNVDPGLITLWTNSSGLASYRSQPSILSNALLTSPIDTGTVAFHYVTATSFTPYVSLGYRMREIDSSAGVDAQVGVYTYDPYDTGIIGRLYGEYLSGFDVTGERIALALDKELSPELSIGGGIDVLLATYTLPTTFGPTTQAYVTGASTYGLGFHLRYDRPHGMGFFVEAEAINQTRVPGPNEVAIAGAGPPATSSIELNGLLGFSYRFGAGAP